MANETAFSVTGLWGSCIATPSEFNLSSNHVVQFRQHIINSEE